MFSLKNVLYFQAGLGVLANMSLLCFYIFIIVGHRPKPTDLISCQLTFIHIMVCLTGGDLLLTDIFESLNINNDFKCKATFYISRVMRCLSICTTCLLSVFQAVTISPSTSCLAKFKQKLRKYMVYIFLCIWSFSFSYSSSRIFYVRGFTNVSESNQMQITKSCLLFRMNSIIRVFIFTVTTSRDVFLVGMMLTTSTYMVIILCRHQRQCKHLHHSIKHLRASPEKRATQTILLLVIFFVVMYWVDFIISTTSVLVWIYDPVSLMVQKFLMYAYPTISPLVQISSDNRIIIMVKNMYSKHHQRFF